MTIQDMGSIGELIAAFATLITLAYLALQLKQNTTCLLYTSPSPRDERLSRMPSSA